MEIIKSRYGSERSIERVDFQRVRVMGEAQFTRVSKSENGEVTMYDFEGGPAYTVGMKIKSPPGDFVGNCLVIAGNL